MGAEGTAADVGQRAFIPKTEGHKVRRMSSLQVTRKLLTRRGIRTQAGCRLPVDSGCETSAFHEATMIQLHEDTTEQTIRGSQQSEVKDRQPHNEISGIIFYQLVHGVIQDLLY